MSVSRPFVAKYAKIWLNMLYARKYVGTKLFGNMHKYANMSTNRHLKYVKKQTYDDILSYFCFFTIYLYSKRIRNYAWIRTHRLKISLELCTIKTKIFLRRFFELGCNVNEIDLKFL